jgi:hypothetical protein
MPGPAARGAFAGGTFVAEDWEDLSVEDKLEALRSAVETLERRQDELLRHLSALADAVDAIELKLRQ